MGVDLLIFEATAWASSQYFGWQHSKFMFTTVSEVGLNKLVVYGKSELQEIKWLQKKQIGQRFLIPALFDFWEKIKFRHSEFLAVGYRMQRMATSSN
ncbi:hypothetical protein Leryth_015424 [Lithospermum erythrorhizon]|nr:hypothetical protein Leryth_015424 [Lithospermum erythrorhizon]